MKKIYIALAIAAVSFTMAAKTAVKHIATQPDEVATQVTDIDHSKYDCPALTEDEINFLKETWAICQREFVNTGALDQELKKRPQFWSYWLHTNVANHREDGYGYWFAIVCCYETAEFADMFDDENCYWVKAFKEFGIRKGIAIEDDGMWTAYEY